MKNKKSKASVIKDIKGSLSIFRVPDLISFNCKKFLNQEDLILKEILDKFDCPLLAIRSSAADEDGSLFSSAGLYNSVLNVSLNEPEIIIKAIYKVIASYEAKRPLLDDDEVIVQEMVSKTMMSGVIFTHDLNTGAPYYVINYDDESGDTDTVTSGNGEYSNRTLYVHRNSLDKLRSERFVRILLAVKELEKLIDSQFLDIEFALDYDLIPYLFQVRTITTQPNWNKLLTKGVDSKLEELYSLIDEKFKPMKGVFGEISVLGQMPDWNPVEMIGRAPRALSLSLYQKLITDSAWRIARRKMGYLEPKGQPLMVALAGQPFIDVRLSFHSFIPDTISTKISEKLVSHWVNQLRSTPEFHDKIEFNIAITAYSFDINQKIDELIGSVLTPFEKEQFKQAHLNHTMELINGAGDGSLSNALDKINLLNEHHILTILDGSPKNLSSLSSEVDICIKLGTVPFSILARHGFIAKTLLISLYHCGIITKDEVTKIQASVRTVASELVDDMNSFQLGKLSSSDFMKTYGHLRPGTYDIMSQRYDQMTDLIGTSMYEVEQAEESYGFSSEQKQKINNLFRKDGIKNMNADKLLSYIREATIAREYGKFIFTRSVSNILELIANFAKNKGLSRDEISHIPISSLINVIEEGSEKNIEERLRQLSKHESEKHEISSAIRLPQLLVDQAGVHIIPFQVSHPNFITFKKITAPSIVLTTNFDGVKLNSKIVIIEGADPGYDWIFSQKIAGLITKYGGANSHMAIRCAEFSIPAAIGCGEQHFERLIKTSRVHLDCAAGLIKPVY